MIAAILLEVGAQVVRVLVVCIYTVNTQVTPRAGSD